MLREDITGGRQLSLRRRKDYWAEKYRWTVGQNNIDERIRIATAYRKRIKRVVRAQTEGA